MISYKILNFFALANYILCIQDFAFDSLQDEFKNFEKYKYNIEADEFYKLAFDYWIKSQQQEIMFRLEEISTNLNVSKYPGELCSRECKEGENRICYFEFTLEFYQAMGVACGKCKDGVEKDCRHPQCIVGDGVEKGVMSINRKIPGPDIQVCKHDMVIVDVRNLAEGTSATLHWHGIHMVKTPFMDGVPFVTQCPIPYATTFRYHFNATEPGTQFYHSHSGHHKANGQYGLLTIRQSKDQEPFGGLYDYDLPEHHVFISDWMHTYAEHSFPGLPSSKIAPVSLLINGRGVFTNSQTHERTKVRPTIYYVTRGKSYLFRLVNGGSHNCPFSMQIESHNFTIVASDSFSVLPHVFDNLVSNSGERYDFVLEANQQIGDYWMRIRGLSTFKPLETYALIRYIDEKYHGDKEYLDQIKQLPVPPFPRQDDPFPSFAVLNHPNATCGNDKNNKCITELTGFDDDQQLRYAKPDHQFFLAFSNYQIPNKEIFQPGQYFHFQNVGSNATLFAAVNNVSLIFPDSPPLTQPESIDKSQICNSTNLPEHCIGKRFCHCVHVLKVKKDSIVELIIVDENPIISRVNHPFHLHGNRFMVTGMGQHPLNKPMTVQHAKHLEYNHLLPRDFFNTSPVFKDTVSIPSRGYVIVRFRAINPGFWLMHCHYEWHSSVGMGVVLQVGDPSEMVKAPSDFPKCGNYLPQMKKTDFL